jgi:hypothetical protein
MDTAGSRYYFERMIGWLILNECIVSGVRKGLRYAGNSVRSFMLVLVGTVVVAKGPNIITMFGVMILLMNALRMAEK